MLPCAGPPILLCLLSYTRSDWILPHISHGGIGVHFIQDRGIEPPLPEMTGGFSTTVDLSGIPYVTQTALFEPLEILQVIRIGSEYHLAVIAALGNMVRKSFRYRSCDPGQWRNLLLEVSFANKNRRWPWYLVPGIVWYRPMRYEHGLFPPQIERGHFSPPATKLRVLHCRPIYAPLDLPFVHHIKTRPPGLEIGRPLMTRCSDREGETSRTPLFPV